MRKLLRPRDYLLLTIGIIGDAFEEIKDPFSIQETGYRNIYGWVPRRWQKHHFQRAVGRLLKTGDIEKTTRSGEPIIRMTSQGRGKWVREFPLFELSQKPWDNLWRIVSFDIPEKLKSRRNSLREKIERLGMGKLQESLYISPFDFAVDLQEFVEDHGLADFVDVFEARHTFGEDSKSLAWRVWNLERLEKKYSELLDLFEEKQTPGSEDRNNLQLKFEEIILDDPLLPKELLPENWVGERVRKLILNR